MQCLNCFKPIGIDKKCPNRIKKYCDKSCYLRAVWKRKITKCETCGGAIRSYEYRKYCSLKCWHSRPMSWQASMPCEWCHYPVKQDRSRRKKFCSMDCRKQYLHFLPEEKMLQLNYANY
jgi:hypothetical protein